MGIPIFALLLAFVSNTLISTYDELEPTFYFISILLFVFSIYFIFFLIYNGFNVKITENISNTFTREYLYSYVSKKIKKNSPYTLVLISIDNITDINRLYGVKNGDKVLLNVAQYIGTYFKEKKISTFPIGHIKAGDFVIGLDGPKEEYRTLLDLLCLKSSQYSVDSIEVSISGAITDSNFSDDLDYMIENLFELQELNKEKKKYKNEAINPSDLEQYVKYAIKNKHVIISSQAIYNRKNKVFDEYFVKLKNENKALHPKSYMKIVKRLGLSIDYDLLILEKILQNCAYLDSKNYGIALAPSSLRNARFLEKLKELVKRYPHARGKLVFILIETEYYGQIKKYNYTLQTLRNEGIKICIDRLGSLHTSFLYLRDLDIDMVRFDASYTKDIQNDEYMSIIEGFNLIAHAKGVKTWLKMLEDKNMLEKADRLHVDYTQGKALCGLKIIYEDII
ncbi:GGDEF domain-containing protein [Sulfurimonas sp. SAG-AH-194-I05]|nr:GGDEF domain-containing protein [Sulfurimonas sp. SAG-AH-194-I05]